MGGKRPPQSSKLVFAAHPNVVESNTLNPNVILTDYDLQRILLCYCMQTNGKKPNHGYNR